MTSTRVYSVRKYRDSQPFTVMDDYDAEMYRDLGFLVEESVIGDTPSWITRTLFIVFLILGYYGAGYLFGFSAVNAVYITFGCVYAMLLLFNWLTTSKA